MKTIPPSNIRANWPQPLAGFIFMMDLSKIPKEKRLKMVLKFRDSQKKIIPMTVFETENYEQE